MTKKDRVLMAVKEHGPRARDITAAIPRNENQTQEKHGNCIRALLNALARTGLVRRMDSGMWELTDAGRARVAELEARREQTAADGTLHAEEDVTQEP